MAKKHLALELSALIVEGLVRYGLRQEDILGGPIEHTMLPWQIPPLINDEVALFEVPFDMYLHSVTYLDPEALYSLWSDALLCLRNQPHKVVTPEGYRATSYAMPSVRTSERQLHLSMPTGYPHGVEDFAGITLSLECAHVLQYNAKLERFVSDEDNYYAVLPGGLEIGVKAGLPVLYDDQWDLNVSGMVQEMLRTPRGAVWEGCDYNIISKVRSVLVGYEGKIRDYDGLNWALQTLRVVDGHNELLEAVRKMGHVDLLRKHRQAVLADAYDVVQQLSITDRQRIETLKHLLVPDVLNAAKFSKLIYSHSAVPPPILTERVLSRMQGAVLDLMRNEERLYAKQ
jgi:hypothetical protein